jgi:hypothetical protein
VSRTPAAASVRPEEAGMKREGKRSVEKEKKKNEKVSVMSEEVGMKNTGRD